MSIKDVYPNYFDFVIVATTNDPAFSNHEVELPIASFYSVIPKGKVRGMEFIVLDMLIDTATLLDFHTTNGNTLTTGITLGDPPISKPVMTDSDTIFLRDYCIYQTGVGAVSWVYSMPMRWSFVGGKLVVGKKINVWEDHRGSYGYPPIFYYRIYYRFVDVPVNEYISMIQFQSD